MTLKKWLAIIFMYIVVKDHEYHSMAVPMACIDALVIEIAKKGGHLYTQSVEDIYQLKENYKIKIQR